MCIDKKKKIVACCRIICIIWGLCIGTISVYAQQEYWWSIAREQMVGKNYSKASVFYAQAVAVYPAEGLLRAEYAYALQKSGNIEQAINEYFLSIGLTNITSDEIFQVKFNIAVAYIQQQEYKKAYDAFGELIQRSPRFALAYLNRANAAIQLQNYKSAKKDYQLYLDNTDKEQQDENVPKMIALLDSYNVFPSSEIDKEEFNKKKQLEEELNEKLTIIKENNSGISEPNSFLGIEE